MRTVNYYEEFNLDPKMSCEELGAALFQEKKKWIHRQNASDLAKRQLAEQKIALIEAASAVFSDKLKRDQYDLKILREQKKTDSKSQKQQSPGQQYSNPKEDKTERGNSNKNIPVPDNEESIDKIIENAKQLYESGDSVKTIDYCRRALELGKENPEIYNCLGLAYWENNEVSYAVDAFKKAIEKYPEEALFFANLAAIYLNATNEYSAALPLLNKAIQMEPFNNYFLGLDITYMFFTGMVDEAEEKIRRHIGENPEDVEYRECVSEAYIAYSDKFLIECENGGAYIPSQQAYDSILYYRKKANELYDSERTQSVLNAIVERGKRTFNKDNLNGIVCLLIGLFFGWLVKAAAILAAGVLVYFSYKPNWLIEKMTLTNKRDIANTVCYYLYVFTSYIIRSMIQIFRLAIEIIFSFV